MLVLFGKTFNCINMEDKRARLLNAFICGLCENVWPEGAPQKVPFFTGHGIAHSLKILEIIEKLVSQTQREKFSLSENEWYIIIASAFIHDIGLQCDFSRGKHSTVFARLIEKVKELNDPTFDLNDPKLAQKQRKYHHYISTLWIKVAQSEYEPLHSCVESLEKPLTNDILNVCQHHSKLKVIPVSNLPESINDGVDLRKLILLFRLADELDIGPHRCNTKILNNFDIPAENAEHWYINYLSRCIIDEMNAITLKIGLGHVDYRKHEKVMQKVIDSFETKNLEIIEELRSHFKLFITFSKVNSKVVEQINQPDEIPPPIIEAIYRDLEHMTYVDADCNYRKITGKPNVYVCWDEESYANEKVEICRQLKMRSQEQQCPDIVIEPSSKDDISRRKEKIKQADCIIVILTRKLSESLSTAYSKGNAEFTELYHICTHLRSDNVSERKTERAIHVLQFEADAHLPFEISQNVVVHDFSLFRSSEKTKTSIGKVTHFTQRTIRTFENEIESIIVDAISCFYTDNKDYKNRLEESQRKLLYNTKSGIVLLSRACFVKTRVFNSVKSGSAYIIRGRKGGGKSTIIEQLSREIFYDDDDYKAIISLEADKLGIKKSFESYTELTTQQEQGRLKSDISYLIGTDALLGIIWRLFLYIHAVFIVYNEYLENELGLQQMERFSVISPKLGSAIREHFEIWRSKQSDFKHPGSTVASNIYTFAREFAFEKLSDMINEALNTQLDLVAEVKSYVESKYTLKWLLCTLFGNIFVESFNEILENCSKKIVITLDQFDDDYDSYRTDAQFQDNYKEVVDFEKQWFRSLVSTTYNIKNKLRDQVEDVFLPLSSVIIFCACLPYDRYYSFIQMSRDAYKYNNETTKLSWSGVELAILLRKRIENIFRAEDLNTKWKAINPRMAAEDVLAYCIEKKYPDIPTTISVQTKTGVQQMPLFQFLLSHSFWRPRDILEYFSAIITAISVVNETNMNENSILVLIRKNCAISSKKIIENEFYSEYKHAITNLKEVVGNYVGANQLMTYKQLFDYLAKSQFVLCDGKTISDPFTIFKQLYEMGFLGIRATLEFQEKCAALDRDIIVFCEGTQPLEAVGTSEFFECEFFVNPIFNEHLKLNMNSPDLICNYSWEYLHMIEGCIN